MSILSKYYDLITEIVIANNEVITIDPDKPYTITYLIDDRNCSQATGIIRGVISDDHTIATIPLDAEDSGCAAIINTYKIVKISPYSFDAHFDNFNNWIGIEVTEKGRIDLRIRYTSGESIVSVEEGNTYDIEYVESVNGTISLIKITAKIKAIIRSTAKEAMPSHINHFTNDIDYILVADCADGKTSSDVRSINVTEIRNIKLVYDIPGIDTSELKNLITRLDAEVDKNEDKYVPATLCAYREAVYQGAILLSKTGITATDLKECIDYINSKYNELMLLEDEYNTVEYDEESNTLYCHENPNQVVITGGYDSNVVKFYTNNPVAKKPVCINIPYGASVIWAASANDIRGDRPYPTPKSPIDETNMPFKLVIDKKAKLGEVYLGYKIVTEQVTDNTEEGGGIVNLIPNSFSTIIKDSEVDVVYMGGNNHLHTGAKNNLLISTGAKVGTVYAGTVEELVDTDGDTLFMDQNMTLRLVGCHVDYVYCGGVNNVTAYFDLKVANATVGTIYGTGTNGGTTYGASISMENGSTVDSFEAISHTGSSYSSVTKISASNVKDIILGSKSADGGSLIESDEENKNVIKLLLIDNATIENLRLGYSNGTKLTTDNVVVAKHYTVTNDPDGLLD